MYALSQAKTWQTREARHGFAQEGVTGVSPPMAARARTRSRTHTHARTRAHACSHLLACLLAFASMSRLLPYLCSGLLLC